MKCRELPPAVILLAGVEGSAPGGFEGAVKPCLLLSSGAGLGSQSWLLSNCAYLCGAKSNSKPNACLAANLTSPASGMGMLEVVPAPKYGTFSACLAVLPIAFEECL